jgi:hypothetical protein
MNDKRAPRRIRAIVTNDQVDHPHNDLANAAWFFRERLTKAFEKNERAAGVFLDMMALVTMTAFALEGYVNFVGGRLIEKANPDPEKVKEMWACFEKRTVKNKIKIIRRTTGMEVDWSKRPYETVVELVGLRNIFAHPKTHRPEQREFEAVGTEDELKKMLRDYRPEYERRLTWEFASRAYDDVEWIWNDLLRAAEIEAHQTWSGGSQGLQFLDYVDTENDA